MISFVSGIVDSVGENDIIVDVNGIGYQVYASATALATVGPTRRSNAFGRM